MVDFSIHSSFKRITLLCCASSIAFAPLTYTQQPIEKFNFIDAQFAIRIERLAEKMEKYVKKEDLKKCIETLLDVKEEVEGYCGIKLNMDRQLDTVQEYFCNNKINMGKDYWNGIRKLFKKA